MNPDPNNYWARMILDSVSRDGHRLSTMHVHMPRIILAEMNTHRSMSRNARSTRAVPTSRLIQEVRENPFVPIRWLGNKPGMQGGEPMTGTKLDLAQAEWARAAAEAANAAEVLFNLGLHKQHAGRVLEPFMWVDWLVSSTDWSNFMALRDHGDAQPEMELVAQVMRDSLDGSTPSVLQPGQWHMPYLTEEDWADAEAFGRHASDVFPNPDEPRSADEIAMENLRRVSVSRCARLSIRAFDGNDTIEAELERFDRLATSRPVHASPMEHVATPDEPIRLVPTGCFAGWQNPEEHGNLKGWRQFRRQIPFNTVTEMPQRRHGLEETP